MNAWRQLLLQVVLRQRARGSMWITWLLLGVSLVPLAAMQFGLVPRHVGFGAAAASLSIAVVIWWGTYLQTAMRLNTPAAACLVPQMRRHLLSLTAVLWLVASLPVAALLGAATGHYGYALLTCAAALLYFALCCRYWWLGFVPTVVWFACGAPGFSPAGIDAALAGVDETAVTLAGLLVLTAPGALALRALFLRGGDAHYWIRTCMDRNARKGRAGMATVSGIGLFRGLDSFYRARLTAPGRPAARLLDALGGRAHWSSSVVIISTLAGATLVWRVFSGADAMRPFVPLVLTSMLLTVVVHIDGLLSAIKNSRVEQGILRLAPIAPPVRDLNRQMALALMGRFGIVWGVYLAASIAVVLATTGPWRAWLCCTVVALAFTPLLLRDHARHPGWKTAQWAAGLVMLVMAPLGGLVEYGGIPLPAIIAGVAVLLAGTAIALAWRWPRALSAAPAFPAGRLAG